MFGKWVDSSVPWLNWRMNWSNWVVNWSGERKRMVERKVERLDCGELGEKSVSWGSLNDCEWWGDVAAIRMVFMMERACGVDVWSWARNVIRNGRTVMRWRLVRWSWIENKHQRRCGRIWSSWCWDSMRWEAVWAVGEQWLRKDWNDGKYRWRVWTMRCGSWWKMLVGLIKRSSARNIEKQRSTILHRSESVLELFGNTPRGYVLIMLTSDPMSSEMWRMMVKRSTDWSSWSKSCRNADENPSWRTETSKLALQRDSIKYCSAKWVW